MTHLPPENELGAKILKHRSEDTWFCTWSSIYFMEFLRKENYGQAFLAILILCVFFQLKYKRRVYKMLNLDEKQLKALHTRTNFRRLLDYVANGQVEKITKMCSKGLDPNFHCTESGGNFYFSAALIFCYDFVQ